MAAKRSRRIRRRPQTQDMSGQSSARRSMMPPPRTPSMRVPTVDRELARQAKEEELAYARTLMDPCAAALQHGPYPGSRGYISRFTQYYQYSLGAGNTAGYIGFCPSGGQSTSSAFANAGSAFAYAATNTYVPGTGFLSTNANGVRCLGACIQLWSDAAPLNITGNIFLGTCAWLELQNAGNVQNFFNLADYQGKLTADCFEQKWYPGASDDVFATNGFAPTTGEGGSKNMIWVGVSGVPAASTYSFRVTWIVEWLPNASSGLNTPSTDTSTGLVLAQTVVKKLNQNKPNWFTKIGNLVENITPYVAQGAKLAAGVAGLLL